MNDKTHNFLFGLAMVLLLISFIISMAILSTNQEEERAKVCKRIGVKANLEYYDVGGGRCGMGESCHYQCKFIDSNGDIVTKNVQ